MRHGRTGQRGALLIMVLVGLLILMLAISAMLLEFERIFRQQRKAYLEGVVKDMAESGLEYEKYLIVRDQQAPMEAPDRIEVGEFYGLAGWFTAWTELSEKDDGDARVISQGELIGAGEEVEFKYTIEAELKRDRYGTWAVIYETRAPGH